MAIDPLALVRAFLAEHHPPLQVWIAPRAAATLRPLLARALPEEASFVDVPAAQVPPGPAILLATAADLDGPEREALLDLTRAALPGRPVICGGAVSRDVLLDAMNHWHVFHLLPARPSAEELADAVLRAHRAGVLEHAATLCALQLQRQCEQQQAVQAELETTREQVLHAERLVAAGGFCRSLSARLVEHLDRLRALEASLRALPADPRRTELLDHTVQNVQAVDALLADLLERARGSAASDGPTVPLPCAPTAKPHDQHRAPRGTPT